MIYESFINKKIFLIYKLILVRIDPVIPMNEFENLKTKFLRFLVWGGEFFVGGGLGYLLSADITNTGLSTLVILFCAYGLRELLKAIIDYTEENKTTAGRKKKKPLSWYFK